MEDHQNLIENNTVPSDLTNISKEDDKTVQLVKQGPHEIKVGLTGYRFVIAIVFSLVSFANAVHWVTFAGCASRIMEAYDLNYFEVDSFSLIYMAIYPFVFLPESYIIDNISLKLGVSLTAITTIIGAGIKCLVNQSLIATFVGQTLIGSFQPGVLNTAGKIAATWFNEKSRVLVTSLCCVANSFGVLAGFGIHSFFIGSESVGETFRNEFFYYMLAEFIGAIVCCVPLLILMKSRPEIPPSISQNEYVSPSLKDNLSILFTNKSFLLLLGSTTCIIGLSNAFATIINTYLSMYDISDEIITYIALSGNFSGIVASLFVSIFLDKKKKYKNNLLFLNCIGFIASVLITVLLEVLSKEHAIYAAFPLYCIIYAALTPTFTIAMDYVCEITYPCGESISEGVIMTSNQISGIIGILICDFFMMYLKEYRWLTNAFGALLFFVSIILFLLIKEKLIRNEKDSGVKELQIENEMQATIIFDSKEI